MANFSADYIVTRTEGGAKSGAILRPLMGTEQDGRLLPFGTGVQLLIDTGTKWKRVRTENDLEGYVSDINLTKAPSPAVARLIASAAHFWRLFEYGKGKEGDDPFHGHVCKMWKEIKMMPPFYPGTTRVNTSHPSFPWSAAGMSAFVRRAGAYDGFNFSSSHAKYIHRSIKERDKPKVPFWGRRLVEDPVRVGDLVCQYRGPKQTYDSAANTDDFTSHTDVICEIRNGYVVACGANNSHSISMKKYSITSDGRLKGPGGNYSADKTTFMFMRNSCPN